MRHLYASLAAGVLAVAAAGAGTAAAQISAKQRVDAAKAQGIVGEQSDGFLGFVRETDDAALRAAVAEINAGRAQLYRQLAAAHGVDPAAPGASAYQKQLEAMPAGQFHRGPDGVWRRR